MCTVCQHKQLVNNFCYEPILNTRIFLHPEKVFLDTGIKHKKTLQDFPVKLVSLVTLFIGYSDVINITSIILLLKYVGLISIHQKPKIATIKYTNSGIANSEVTNVWGKKKLILQYLSQQPFWIMM